jgi:hypothetical protein
MYPMYYAGEGVVHIAARNGRVDILEHCALRGVNMGRTNYAGLNALHIACSYGNTAAALYLGKHIDVNAPYKTKSNALKLALEGKHFETARSLKARYPQLRIPDVWTAVMLRDLPTVLSMIQGAFDTSTTSSALKDNSHLEDNVAKPKVPVPVNAVKKRLSGASLFSSHTSTPPPTATTTAAQTKSFNGSQPNAGTVQNPSMGQSAALSQAALISEAMFHACKCGWTELVRLLLRRYGASSAWERTNAVYGVLRPVDVVVEEGNLHLLKLLLKGSKNLTIKGLPAPTAPPRSVKSPSSDGISAPETPHSTASRSRSDTGREIEQREIRYHPVIRYLVNLCDSFTGVAAVPSSASFSNVAAANGGLGMAPAQQQHCLLLRAIRKRHFAIAAILIKCGADVNLLCSGKYLVQHLLQSGLEHIERCGESKAPEVRAVNDRSPDKRRQSSAVKSHVHENVHADGANPVMRSRTYSVATQNRMKQEMFSRLDQRENVDEPLVMGSRERSRNVFDDGDVSFRDSLLRLSGDLRAGGAVGRELGQEEHTGGRDSDDDTDYGENMDEDEAEDSDDDELWGSESSDVGDIDDISNDDDGEDDSNVSAEAGGSSEAPTSAAAHTDKLIKTILAKVTQTLSLMVEHGSDMLCRDNLGNTNLHYASKYEAVYTASAPNIGPSRFTLTSPLSPENNTDIMGSSENGGAYFALSDLSLTCSRNEIASIVINAIFHARNLAGKSPWTTIEPSYLYAPRLASNDDKYVLYSIVVCHYERLIKGTLTRKFCPTKRFICVYIRTQYNREYITVPLPP